LIDAFGMLVGALEASANAIDLLLCEVFHDEQMPNGFVNLLGRAASSATVNVLRVW